MSDYNNPERYRNKDMKVNLNKGAIEGLFLEQGSSFPLLDEGGKPSPLHDYRELLIEHLRAEKFQSCTSVTNVPAAASSSRAGPRISSFSSHASPTSGKRRS